jgi:hypothetical protein
MRCGLFRVGAWEMGYARLAAMAPTSRFRDDRSTNVLVGKVTVEEGPARDITWLGGCNVPTAATARDGVR